MKNKRHDVNQTVPLVPRRATFSSSEVALPGRAGTALRIRLSLAQATPARRASAQYCAICSRVYVTTSSVSDFVATVYANFRYHSAVAVTACSNDQTGFHRNNSAAFSIES